MDKPAGAASAGDQIIRLAVLTAMSAIASVGILVLFFPGYLAPSQPFLPDHFEYLAMPREGYGLGRYIVSYPRPLAHILIDLCGRLGLNYMLLPIYAGTIANAVLLIFYVERLMKRRVALVGVCVFLVVVFAHPQYYWSYKIDPFAVLSFTCLMLVCHLWQGYVETRRRWLVAVALFFSFCLTEIKEPYIPALVLFFLVQALVSRRDRWTALLCAAASAVFAAVSIAHTAHVWTLFHTATPVTDPYYTNLEPRSVIRCWFRLVREMVHSAPLIAVAICVAVSFWRNRRTAWIGVVLALLAGSTLFPNATLPNHLVTAYGWLGVLLFAAPILTTATLLPTGPRARTGAWAVALLLCALCLRDYARPNLERTSLRNHERLQATFLRTMPILRDHPAAARNNLVFGLASPLSIFHVSNFVSAEFGSTRMWTVVVPDSEPESASATTRLVHASNVPDEEYDRLFVYDDRNMLEGLYEREPLEALRTAGRFPVTIRFVSATSP